MADGTFLKIERAEMLANFRKGGLDVLVTCRALDEGHAEILDDLIAAAIGTGLSKTEATRTVASATRTARL